MTTKNEETIRRQAAEERFVAAGMDKLEAAITGNQMWKNYEMGVGSPPSEKNIERAITNHATDKKVKAARIVRSQFIDRLDR